MTNVISASAPADEEEVGWDEESSEEEESDDEEEEDEEDDDDEDEDDDDDDDDEDDEDDSPTPNKPTNIAASVGTLKPKEEVALKPAQPRRSNDEKSVADSDASYDLVSGATSRAPGSPQDKKKDTAADDSDEDWE